MKYIKCIYQNKNGIIEEYVNSAIFVKLFLEANYGLLFIEFELRRV